MAARIAGVTVTGVNQLVKDLRDMGVELSDIKGAFRVIADQAADVARDAAPQRKGKLRRTIRGAALKNKAVIVAGQKPGTKPGKRKPVVGKRNVVYAGAVNWGWGIQSRVWKHGKHASKTIRGSHQGTPFLEAADTWAEANAPKILDTEISAIIKKEGLG